MRATDGSGRMASHLAASASLDCLKRLLQGEPLSVSSNEKDKDEKGEKDENDESSLPSSSSSSSSMAAASEVEPSSPFSRPPPLLSPLGARDGHKQTLLHYAARAGHLPCLRYLLTLWPFSNLNPNFTPSSSYSSTPSSSPSSSSSASCSTDLSMSLAIRSEGLDCRDRWHRTPLHWCAFLFFFSCRRRRLLLLLLRK